jgi:transcriptional regulator with XRE-family HTH domain
MIPKREPDPRAAHRRRERERARDERRKLHAMRQQDMGLGYLVYCARRWGRLSQTDLARDMGTTRQNVSRWERGDRAPSLWKLQWIAEQADLDLVIGMRSRRTGPLRARLWRVRLGKIGGEDPSVV